MFKRLVLVISSTFLVLTSVLALPATAHAQTWYNQSFTEWYLKVYDESVSPPNQIFGERYTAAQVQWVIYGLVSLPLNLLGRDNQKIVSCFLTSVAGGSAITKECAGAAIIAVGQILDRLWPGKDLLSQTESTQAFSPKIALNTNEGAISGINYVKHLVSKFNPIQKVKAQQGFGFSSIDAIQIYWKGFRNIAYFFTVLIVIVFAFMIMFRVKLSPQTVISVQSALPKIIIAIILATFSYAIAGFLIDLTYVVGGVFATLIHSSGLGFSSDSIIDVYNMIIPSNSSGALGNFYILFYMFAYWILFAFAIIWSFVTTLTQLSVYGMLASIVMIFVWVWVLVLVLWYTIKIPFVLLKNLISIYLSIVLAPIQITMGALVPQIGFGQWFKKLAAELMVYPVVGVLLYFAMTSLINSFRVNFEIITQVFGDSPGKLWAPEIIGSGADMSGLLWVVISFGILILVPKAVELVKSLVMGEKFTFGTAVGEAVGAGKAAWGMTGAPIWNAAKANRESNFISNKFTDLRDWLDKRYPGKGAGIADKLGIENKTSLGDINKTLESLKEGSGK